MTDDRHRDSRTRLTGRRLVLARLVWLTIVLVGLGFFIVAQVEKYRHPLQENCQQVECNPIELTTDDAAQLGSESAARTFAVILVTMTLLWNLTFLAVAALIFWRRSDDWMALLLSLALALLGTVAFSPANSVLPAEYPEWDGLVTFWESMSYVSLLLLLLVFPDGRFVPRWTPVALPVLLLFVIDAAWFRAIDLLLISFPFYVVVGIYSQVYRYRRVSNPLQRQQTKWVALGLTSVVVDMALWILLELTFPAKQPNLTRTSLVLAGTPAVWLIATLFPVSVGVATLRYRLWDIDLLIRRTLVYSALTATLAATYFGSVVGLEAGFRAVTGQGQGQFSIVLSTLAIAALFAPLRRRIQAGIDHRFYRRRYDAAQTLAAFSATAREEVELDRLTERLVEVVRQTLQPEHVSLWLRPAKEKVSENTGE